MRRGLVNRLSRWSAASEPGLETGHGQTCPGPVRRADYPVWAAQLAAAGNCAHPVRLQGKITATDTSTGEHNVLFTTVDQPDRVLLKACGSRRATPCPACAATYAGDARALILAGLLGGKGVDPAVADHPLVVVTLTAPASVPSTSPPREIARRGAPSVLPFTSQQSARRRRVSPVERSVTRWIVDA